MDLVVSTERLGWPAKRWWRDWLATEQQKRRRYADEPDRPTATCHLQEGPELPALCGFPWEMLLEIPCRPGWEQLHPDLRCDECSSASGNEVESGGPYLYDFDRP